MAFFSVALLNLLLWGLLGMLALGAALSAACLVFALRSRLRARAGEKRLCLLCGVLAAADFCILGGAAALALRPQMALVETASGPQALPQSTANEFVGAIAADDASRVASMLGEHPELLGYITLEGYCPLGAAIRYGAADVARCLLETGVDVDRVDRGGENAETSVSLLCRMSPGPEIDVEMLGLLLDYGAQVNGGQNALPPIQFVLRHICADGEIGESDLALFRRFLESGADFNAVNGLGEDGAAYFERLAAEGGIAGRQPDAVQTLREWMAESAGYDQRSAPSDSGR